jgi:TolB protein
MWYQGTEVVYLGKAGHRSWHPDSERIIYVGRHTDKAGLWEVRWDGSSRRCITTDRDVYGSPGTHPSFSPDGEMIVSESYVPGKFGLYLLTPDGEGGRWLDTPSGTDEVKSHMHPCWSPDGSKIIYDCDETGECQVYIAEVPSCVPS